MEVSYKKDFGINYMIIKAESQIINDYKMRMVCDNKIKGFNSVSVKVFNDKESLYYDISGKISMENKFFRSKMRSKDIREYIMGIQTVLESAKKYMLDVDKILLDFDCVYMTVKEDIPHFCYYPEKKESFAESLQRAFDRIIELADHRDKETVILSYGLQQMGLGENNITIKDIVKFINEGNEKEQEYGEEIDEVDNGAVYRNDVDDITLHCKETYVSEATSYGSSVTKGKSLQEIISGIFEPIRKAKEKMRNSRDRYQQEDQLDDSNDKLFYERSDTEYIDSECREETEYMDNDCDATILLRTGRLLNGIILKCSDIENPQTIVPNDYPCIIGKSKKSADYIINDSTVSRVHLRIHEEGGEYFVEDLNSTNGTYLNDEKIKPHQLAKLNIGDRIKLSELEYIVC